MDDIRDSLLDRANGELFWFDRIHFKQDCDEILKAFAKADDPAEEYDNLDILWDLLRARTSARKSFVVREWLRKKAEDDNAALILDRTDFRDECDEILKEYVYADVPAAEAKNRSKLWVQIRLCQRAKQEFLAFDWADFRHDCSEILEEYTPNDDPAADTENLNKLWNSLRVWQRDQDYLSSLKLHRVIAKHVRISCRDNKSDDKLESWVKLDSKSARMKGLEDVIANAIQGAWKVQKPLEKDEVSKYSGELSFHRLDDFHLGLETLIGYPPTNENFLKLMKKEHELGKAEVYQKDENVFTVDPKVEWNIVMKSELWNIIEASDKPTTNIKKRKCGKPLDFYVKLAEKKFADAGVSCPHFELNEAEVAALRLWTGPMHRIYAQVLRDPKGQSSPYVTTLHAINSGITKLARIRRLPASRKVYRGYRNLNMSELKKDAFDCIGGVENCVLATSEDFNIAVDYSGDGAFILEMDVGQVNRGADVSWLSQFPHEREILFNALSNIEFVRRPQKHFIEGRGTIMVYQVCVSANVKSKTLEEFVCLRKDLHLNLVDVLTQEARQMIDKREAGCSHGLIKTLGDECRKESDDMRQQAQAADFSIFNEGTEAYLKLVESAILFPSRSCEVIDLTLQWLETPRADPAQVDRLQDWQLMALRTSFQNAERPEVTTIALEQDRRVESLFRARSLNVGAIHKLDTACSVAKLLTLNPVLESLEMEAVSATADWWESVFRELCPGRPRLRVNGFHLAEHAISTLQQLELRNADDLIATMIAPALLHHAPTGLTSLSLWGSPIACAGAECLGRAFSNLQMLKFLDLRSCRIADRGCTGISLNLSILTLLEDINLAFNDVKDEGFEFLVCALEKLSLTTLKSVDIRFNKTQHSSLLCVPQCFIRSNILLKLWNSTSVRCVAWSPGGDQIAGGSDEWISIWDATTGVLDWRLQGHHAAVVSVAWSPHGNQIASGSVDETIIIWDATTGAQTSRLTGHTSAVSIVSWNIQGDRIASGSGDKMIFIWDTKNGCQVATLEGHTDNVRSVAWNPDGELLAIGSCNENLMIWNAKNGVQISTFTGHTSAVLTVAWNPKGHQIASGSNSAIIIWDATTGDRVSALEASAPVKSISWSLNEQIACWSSDGVIIIWDAKADTSKVLKLIGHTDAVNSVAWSPNNSYQIAGGFSEGVVIWDAQNWEQVPTLKGHASPVNSVAWNPKSDQIASGSSDNTIVIWDVKKGCHTSTLKGHALGILSVAWNPGGDLIASGSEDRTSIIWDTQSGVKLLTCAGHTKRVFSVVWSPLGDQIASGSDDKTIIIWDVKTGNKVRKLEGHTEAVLSVAWSPNVDHIASGSGDNTVVIWDAKTGSEIWRFTGHTREVMYVAWCPEDDQIVSASLDKTVIFWDAKTRSQVSSLPVSMPAVHFKNVKSVKRSVALSPRGDQIASGLDDMITIWNTKTGELVSTLKGHCFSHSALCLAWNSEGDHIASGSVDKTLVIWDAKACVRALESEVQASMTAKAIRDAWMRRKVDTPKMSDELTFSSLDHFHLGLETFIGYPPTNQDFLTSMKQEHEQGDQFYDTKGSIVDPKVEWNIVMKSELWNILGAGHEPTTSKYRHWLRPLDFYVKLAEKKFADAGVSGQRLNVAEVAALRLWTGPMRTKYEQVFRHLPPHGQSSPYATTLHAINSGITKLARIRRLPASRKVYIGYRNLNMSENLKKDAFDFIGGVEKCVLATSEDFNVAAQYSGDGAFILEMDVGQVNRGADVSWLSQFPHEREILFNALSNIEFVRRPQKRFIAGGGTILVCQVCVSANVKSKTLEEFVCLRKDLHLNLVDVLTQEARQMIDMREAGCSHGLIKTLGDECRKASDDMRQQAQAADFSIFNEGTEAYLKLAESAILLPSRSCEVIDLALLWLETPRADPAQVDRLQDWQLTALRTSFRNAERPEVTTIALEQDRRVESLFRARSLNVGAIHKLDTACSVAKLLSLNPELESLEMEAVSATAEWWESVFRELCPGRPRLRVNGFHLAEYAVCKLQQLELRNAGEQIATMIAPALLHHAPTGLISLSLWGTPIACAGAECLGRAFSNLQMLKYLDLRSCQIADRGCTGIAQSLCALDMLENLKLSHNNVHDDGFTILASTIRHHGLKRLKSVDIKFNNTQLPSLQCGTHCVIKNHLVTKFFINAAASCVVWSPRGDQIACGSRNTTITIWDAKTGDTVVTLKGHSNDVTSVAWRPGGDQIASASYDRTVIIWDAKTGDQISTLKGHIGRVTSVVWRPGGDQIASASVDETIIIWDATTWEQISILKGHTEAVSSVAWRPGGDQIASGSGDETIIIWDAKTGEQVSTLKGHTSHVNCVAWRPGGDLIASCSADRSIIIWDPKTGDQVSTLMGNTMEVTSVAWRPEGDQIASGLYDSTIIIWDAKTGEQIMILEGHAHHVTSVAWRPGGDQIASASEDNTFVIWDVKPDSEVPTLKGHIGEVTCLAWCPGGDQIASGSYDKSIIIWDAKTCKQISTLKGHIGLVTCVAWRPGGDQIISGSADETIIVWDAKTGGKALRLKGHTDYVCSISWNSRGTRIASGSRDKTIIIWDVKTGDKVSTLRGHTNDVKSVAWSPVAEQIVSGSKDNALFIWDVDNGIHVCTLKGHFGEVYCVGWSASGERIASGSGDKTIIIWDPKIGVLVSVLKGHSDKVNSVAWSLNGQLLASASDDKTVIVWDADTGAVISHLKGHSDIVNCVVWSASGEQVMSCSRDKTVIVWDSKTEEQRMKLEAKKGFACSSSEESTILASTTANSECGEVQAAHPEEGCMPPPAKKKKTQ